MTSSAFASTLAASSSVSGFSMILLELPAAARRPGRLLATRLILPELEVRQDPAAEPRGRSRGEDVRSPSEARLASLSVALLAQRPCRWTSARLRSGATSTPITVTKPDARVLELRDLLREDLAELLPHPVGALAPRARQSSVVECSVMRCSMISTAGWRATNRSTSCATFLRWIALAGDGGDRDRRALPLVLMVHLGDRDVELVRVGPASVP